MLHISQRSLTHWGIVAIIILGAAAVTSVWAALTFEGTTITGGTDVTINGAATGAVTIGSNVTSGAITIGSATAQNVSITDNNWSISAAGAASFVSLALGGTTLTATGTELNYVDGVTSAIQTQLDAKAPSTSPTFTGNLTLSSEDIVATGNSLATAAQISADVVRVVASSGAAYAVKLPAASPGRVVHITVNANLSNVTLFAASGDAVDGEAFTMVPQGVLYSRLCVAFDTTNWRCYGS